MYHCTLSPHIFTCSDCKPKVNKKGFLVFPWYRLATCLSTKAFYTSSARINQTVFLRQHSNRCLDLPFATICPEEFCNTGLYEVHHNSLLPAVLVLGILFLVQVFCFLGFFLVIFHDSSCFKQIYCSNRVPWWCPAAFLCQ